jgi:hypothetical protein
MQTILPIPPSGQPSRGRPRSAPGGGAAIWRPRAALAIVDERVGWRIAGPAGEAAAEVEPALGQRAYRRATTSAATISWRWVPRPVIPISTTSPGSR